MMITALSLLFLSFITIILIKFIHKVIWIPFHVQRMMREQGITGPTPKFIYGTSKESYRMKVQAASAPMELSHDIFPRAHPHFYTWMTLYGKNFLTWGGPRPHMVITEPDLAKEMLTNKDGVFIKIKAEGAVEKLLGDGLVMAEGKKWMKLRKLANHAFYAENLKEMVPAMIASVESMLRNWKQYEGREMEISQEFTLVTSEVISRTAFGSSYVEGNNIFEMLTKLGILLFKNVDKVRPWGLNKIWKSEDDVESDKLEKSLCDSVMEIVKKREEKVSTGNKKDFGSDFLGLLLAVHHDADKKNRISIDNVIDECKVFFLAGHETTSSLLTWSCLLLSIHTDWQDRVRKEVFEVFGHDNPTAEGLPMLKTMNMIINETLRLYSPAASLIRRVTSKAKLGKYNLPANMELHIPIQTLHRSQELWGSDSHLFKPERFKEGIAKATKNNPMAFVPFGYGPRTCVGLNFANNEAKIALSMILQRYKFTLSSIYVHAPLALVTVRPQHGLQVMLQPLK